MQPQNRRIARPVADRLWERTDRSGECWLWLGALSPKGYGSMIVGSKTDGTHRAKRVQRIAWEITYGPIPEGLFVCHHCDVPRCVRPSHLFLGTAAENTADMMAKGRESRTTRSQGITNVNAVLDDAKVREILDQHALGRSCTELARAFGVRTVTISKIVTGQGWGHVGGPRREPIFQRRNLTAELVATIRTNRASGLSISESARALGITTKSVWRVLRGDTYQSL